MLPNFLGIGAQRAATTWLFECLREHPEIYLPPQKEIHFFDENFDKGLEWYESFFNAVTTEKAIGEITPNYYHLPHALQRIKEVLPDVKLILSLRHPLERAYSAYKLLHEYYADKGVSFEEAFKEGSYLLDLSLYSKHLENIFKLFPRSQVHIIIYDDILSDPLHVVRKLYSFLGVSIDFVPQAVFDRYNRIIFPRFQNFIISLKLGFLLDLIKKTPLAPLIKKLHAQFFYSHSKSSYSVDTHVRQLLLDDIQKLKSLIKRNLPWVL